jgi:hypothetical protein
MRIASIIALLPALAAAPGAGAAAFEAVDPSALVVAARERAREGDHATARILLERAARIAPWNERAAQGLRELDGGGPASAAPPPIVPVKAAPAPSPVVPPEPPAPWPAR